MSTKVGTFVQLEIGGTKMVGETSHNLTSAAEMIETSSKASGNESSFEYGRINQTASVSSIASSNASETNYNFKDALEAQVAGTKVTFEMTEYDSAGDAVVGAISITGTALLSNVSKESPDNDKMTFSLDLQFDGNATVGTNA